MDVIIEKMEELIKKHKEVEKWIAEYICKQQYPLNEGRFLVWCDRLLQISETKTPLIRYLDIIRQDKDNEIYWEQRKEEFMKDYERFTNKEAAEAKLAELKNEQHKTIQRRLP